MTNTELDTLARLCSKLQWVRMKTRPPAPWEVEYFLVRNLYERPFTFGWLVGPNRFRHGPEHPEFRHEIVSDPWRRGEITHWRLGLWGFREAVTNEQVWHGGDLDGDKEQFRRDLMMIRLLVPPTSSN